MDLMRRCTSSMHGPSCRRARERGVWSTIWACQRVRSGYKPTHTPPCCTHACTIQVLGLPGDLLVAADGQPAGYAALAGACHLTALTDLTLYDCRPGAASEAGLRMLAGAAFITQLRCFNLYGSLMNEAGPSDAIFWGLHLPRLQVLGFHAFDFLAGGNCEAAAGLATARLPELKRLHVDEYDGDNLAASVRGLVLAGSVPVLQEIHLSAGYKTHEVVKALGATLLPTLRVLAVPANPDFDSQLPAALAASHIASQLTRLMMTQQLGDGFGTKPWAALAAAPLSSLRALELELPLHADGAEALGGAQWLGGLIELFVTSRHPCLAPGEWPNVLAALRRSHAFCVLEAAGRVRFEK